MCYASGLGSQDSNTAGVSPLPVTYNRATTVFRNQELQEKRSGKGKGIDLSGVSAEE